MNDGGLSWSKAACWVQFLGGFVQRKFLLSVCSLGGTTGWRCQISFSYLRSLPDFVFNRETNLKFKMGLRVTDERLQHERQLAAFDGECGRAEKRHLMAKN